MAQMRGQSHTGKRVWKIDNVTNPGPLQINATSTLIEFGLGASGILAGRSAGGAALDPLVYHWQDHDLDRTSYQSPDHHDRQRLLDFGPRPGRNDERQEADAAYQSAQ